MKLGCVPYALTGQRRLCWLARSIKESEVLAVRPPSNEELAVLLKLVTVEFPGAPEVRTQLQSLQVEEVDLDGSLTLVSSSGVRADVIDRVPIEGEAIDADGVRIHLLLHVVDGRAVELEIFKEDGSRVLKPVLAERMTVVTAR